MTEGADGTEVTEETKSHDLLLQRAKNDRMGGMARNLDVMKQRPESITESAPSITDKKLLESYRMMSKTPYEQLVALGKMKKQEVKELRENTVVPQLKALQKKAESQGLIPEEIEYFENLSSAHDRMKVAEQDMGDVGEGINRGVNVAQGVAVGGAASHVLTGLLGTGTFMGTLGVMTGTIGAGAAAMWLTGKVGGWTKNVPVLNKIPERGWRLGTRVGLLAGGTAAAVAMGIGASAVLVPASIFGGLYGLMHLMKRKSDRGEFEAQEKKKAAMQTTAASANSQTARRAEEPQYSIAA